MEKVVASLTFRTAAAQRKFLRYVVTETLRGRGELLKEYSIGVAVFHKKETFDPRLDSIVRSEAHKLRARLAKYYKIEGKEDAVRIEIPVGKYAAVFKGAAGEQECLLAEPVAEGVRSVELTPMTVPARRVENSVNSFEDPGLLFSAGFYPIESLPERVFDPQTGARSGRAVRIAVLPFMNRSDLVSDEFFSDGLTDELTHAFTRVAGFEVVARTGAEFRRGLDLCPSSVIGHAWYGTYLVSVGRGEDGLVEQRKVLDLDPISVPALFSYAQTLYTLRRYDEAIDYFRKALSLNPGFPREHAGLGLACIRKGSFTRGIAELELAQAFTKGLGRVKANLAYAYGVAGYRGKAADILNEFLSDFDPKRFPALMIAEVYIGLGDKDKAFEWLHKAIDQKDIGVFLKADPLYDPLRTDPRFGNLLKRMNLA